MSECSNAFTQSTFVWIANAVKGHVMFSSWKKKQQDVKLLNHISVYIASKAKVEKLHGAGLPLNTVIYWPRF